MEKQVVKEIAMKHGLIHEAQNDRHSDAVYAFASELLCRVRHGHETMNMVKGMLLTEVLYLIHTVNYDSNNMDIVRALNILRTVRNELVNPPKPHTDTKQIGRMAQLDLFEDMSPMFDLAQPSANADAIQDPVNHPSHYTSHPSGVEAIEITRHMGFNLGNAMKYLWRNGLKDGQPAVQDLEKAVWYIQDEIKRLKSTQNENL